MTAKEYKVPLGLIASGLLLVTIYSFKEAGADEALTILLLNLVGLAINVVLGIAALYIVASLMSIGFGEVSSAALKLAAIFLFPGAVALFLPGGLNWLVAFALYIGLLVWLLELDTPLDVVVCMIVIVIVRFVAITALGAIAA